MTARYDRLAPLNAPDRERTFPGWAVLRDLDGAERDGDSARRARLRFLALRPAYRLVARGFGAVPLESVERQIDRVREELGQLPARDQERAALAALLNDLRSRDPEVVISAILSVSEFAEANGYLGAAEEYARVALELARSTEREPFAIIATRGLARVALSAGQLEQAAARAQEACDLALAADDRGEWIEAIGQLAAFHRRTGDASQARDALLVALTRAREWGNDALVGLALAQLCRDAAESGQPETVIEYGWPALRSLERTNDRAVVLSLLGDALNTLGLSQAADRCYALVTLRASTPALRIVGLVGSALVAAQNADRERYRERRAATLRELAPAHRFARASAHVELGRAAWLVDDQLLAREHLREAFVLLRDHNAAPIRARAEELLHAMEQETSAQLLRRSDAAVLDQTRRIAAELEDMPDFMVTAE